VRLIPVLMCAFRSIRNLLPKAVTAERGREYVSAHRGEGVVRDAMQWLRVGWGRATLLELGSAVAPEL
jgi:hypothetical protein